MDKAPLVADDLVDGQQLIDALERRGVEVKAALWLYEPDDDRWRFVLASPGFKKRRDPLKAYRALREALPASTTIDLSRISLVDEHDAVITRLRSAFKTTRGQRPVRVSKSTVDEIFVDDAWI